MIIRHLGDVSVLYPKRWNDVELSRHRMIEACPCSPQIVETPAAKFIVHRFVPSVTSGRDKELCSSCGLLVSVMTVGEFTISAAHNLPGERS